MEALSGIESAINKCYIRLR